MSGSYHRPVIKFKMQIPTGFLVMFTILKNSEQSVQLDVGEPQKPDTVVFGKHTELRVVLRRLLPPEHIVQQKYVANTL